MPILTIKKSSVVGRAPTGLQPAELAVNLADEKLFTAKADGTVFELGGSGSGVIPSPVPPSDKQPGDLWYDENNNTLNYWNGATWVELGQAGDSPVTSVNGEVGVVVLDAGDVGAVAIGDVNPVYFANQAAFPDAASSAVHGGVAHSHADGAMFFAHGGSWQKLANSADLSDYVPLGSWDSIGELS